MTPATRYLRFNLVGLLGAALQLSLLALLLRLIPRHPLLATALALEATLLHNYAWHRRYTWPDRANSPHTLVRFHLTNGALSLAGNLLLMRLLVTGLHLRPVPANAIAILGCSLINYTAAHRWAFAAIRHPPSHPSATPAGRPSLLPPRKPVQPCQNRRSRPVPGH